MKKDTLLEIILGTIGGLIFAFGMCMCLIPEWNLFKAGIVVGVVGFLTLLCIIPVYRNSHPRKKEQKKVNYGIIFAWVIGVIGSLIMGFGMSKIMTGEPTQNDILLGLITGSVGLIVCVLDYPVYSYIKGNKE